MIGNTKPKILTMKYLSIFLICLLPAIGTTQVIEKTIQAINTMQIDTLGTYLDKSIDLTIDKEYDYLSRDQAVKQIKSFLAGAGSVRISSRHKGNSKTKNSNYKIADMVTSNSNYRVFIYTEKKGESEVIKELRFDKV